MKNLFKWVLIFSMILALVATDAVACGGDETAEPTASTIEAPDISIWGAVAGGHIEPQGNNDRAKAEIGTFALAMQEAYPQMLSKF